MIKEAPDQHIFTYTFPWLICDIIDPSNQLRTADALHLSPPSYVTPVTSPPATQETFAEWSYSRLSGGLQGVQLRWKLPVQCDQCGNHRRQCRKPGAGQPEEIHPVWSRGASQQQCRDRALLHRGGCHHAGGW